MRTRSVVPVLVAFSAGLTAAAAVRRFVDRRRAPARPAAVAVAAPVALPEAVGVEAVRQAVRQAVREAVREGVVLPFVPPAVPAPAAPASPARCGESGGRTKAGAPCAARATSGGRCHHHRIAA